MKFSDLKQNVKMNMVVLVGGVEEKQTKNKTAYCSIQLCDGEKKVAANMWNTTRETVEEYVGQLVTANMVASMYNGQTSYVVNYLLPAPEGSRIDDFIKKAPMDPEVMYAKILEMIPDCPLKKIVLSIYGDHKNELLYWAAARSVHHNLYSGLLYHTYRMMEAGVKLCEVYAGLNRCVLLPAIALHDIGKLKEMSTNILGEAEYTVDGVLSGHLVSGHDMIRDTAKRYKSISEEEIRLLDHCILSHHGKLEFGAVKLPATPEAMALHLIDDFDAKMYQMEESYASMEPGSFSDPKYTMDNVRIYKPIL